MKIVHFADLHLDRPFAWAGASGGVAQRRRQGLRDTLLRIADLARDVEADAVFCGGDLYEQEHFTSDTREFLRSTFAALAPIRVFIAPGNHDWYGPSSLYALTEWPPNVHVFRESGFRAVMLGEGLTLWGAAHCAPANTPNFLDGFQVNGAGVHLALFHGAERSSFPAQGERKEAHAPFDAGQILRAGLHHAFLGHYHRPRAAEYHTYPGNPDPLEFGEDGTRGAVVATITHDGTVTREWHVVAVTQAHDIEVDVTGCVSMQDVRDRVRALAAGLAGVARFTICGELDPVVDLRLDRVRDLLTQLEAHQLRVGALRTGYDLEALQLEQTVKGEFVRDVLAAGLSPERQRRVLVTGLRALDGRSDLEVL